MNRVLAVVLAGGKGSRLEPLTLDRAKPAVPFGGAYRIIDFTLSNCLNSGLRKMLVLTQYKAMSLDRHINVGWRRYLCRELGEFIDIVPPQQRVDEHWYRGTADAVYQNIYTIEKEDPEHVIILAGDHIYKMDYKKMVDFHRERRADVTVAALRVPCKMAARQFGVMEVDNNWRIQSFEEKPEFPKSIPGNPEETLASMGIYVFNTEFMFNQLCESAAKNSAAHDFGHHIIPKLVQTHAVYAYEFKAESRKEHDASYWRDVGTLDAYYEANMDLVAVDPQLNMYDANWPIRSFQPILPPPKFVFADPSSEGRRGEALDSVVCSGTIVSGGHVHRSILGFNARIHSYARVEDSILFEGVDIGRGAVVRRAIIDKGVRIPPGMQVGVDPERDRAQNFTITENGIVVIAKQGIVDEAEPVFSAR